jgi:hypothetical protein
MLRGSQFAAICAVCSFVIVGCATAVRAGPASVVFDSVSGKGFEPVLVPSGITWNDAESDAIAAGGYLACPTDSELNAFVFSQIDTSAYWTALSVNSDFLGPWLGASSSNNTDGTDATWTWVNGATFSFAPWGPNQPDGYPGDIPQQAITYYDFASIGSTWGDTPQDGVAGFDLPQGYIIEFNQNPNGSPVPLPGAGWTSLVALAVLGGIRIIKSVRTLASQK